MCWKTVTFRRDYRWRGAEGSGFFYREEEGGNQIVLFHCQKGGGGWVIEKETLSRTAQPKDKKQRSQAEKGKFQLDLRRQ